MRRLLILSLVLLHLALQTSDAADRPLRDGKGSVYEGGIRVPTFVSWSGQ